MTVQPVSARTPYSGVNNRLWTRVVFGLTPAAAQQTLYVDANAPAGGDGTSWGTALNTLQGALDIAAVNGMVEAIRIAEGTYRPSHETVAGDARSATF